MKSVTAKARYQTSARDSVSEILVLSDGRIFAHNISPAMAVVLAELNPEDEAMRRRANLRKNSPNDLSD